MNHLEDSQPPVHNVAPPTGITDPTTVQAVPNAIEFICNNIELPEVREFPGMRLVEEISEWSPAAQSRAYLKRFRATQDITDLSLAQEHARALRDTRSDGEMATSTIAKKWDRLLAVNMVMKKQFGVIDARDTSKLRDITVRLGGRGVGRNEVIMSWVSQWVKTERYLTLAELTETPEDQAAALHELHIMIDDIKAGTAGKLVGEKPFTVATLYQLGKVEEARQLVDTYLSAKNTKNHYLAEPLIDAVVQTQDPTEIELALRVVNETVRGYDDGHSRGLCTKYGTKLSEIAARMGNPDLAQKAAELIPNPKRREQMLGNIAFYGTVGILPNNRFQSATVA